MLTVEESPQTGLHLAGSAHLGSKRSPTSDRTAATLLAVFIMLAAFYLAAALAGHPRILEEGRENPYNELASAFLHLHLSVGRAPTQLLRLANPYDPAQNESVLAQTHPSLHDFVLYRGKLFLTWGPAPAVVLAAAHLADVEPSSRLITVLFAIAGLAFTLATLRIVLRQLGEPPLWASALAAATLALGSVVPFILRHGAVYEEAISGGFCFAMAAIWLAMSAIASRNSSWRRLLLMSLCFGLAAGSRPTLMLVAPVMVPVYLSLRSSRPRGALLTALVAPFGVCILALAAYNQARFGSPLEVGAKYQLAGYDARSAHYAEFAYVAPGTWAYLMAPPRPDILFPFVALAQPPLSYPATPPSRYPLAAEPTGGLLPMAPILIFLAPLPWLWRRRLTSLGPLALPLLTLVGCAAAMVVFLSYEFFGTTERYEVDFATLLLLGALAAWLGVCREATGVRRRLLQAGGAFLAVWACITGLAASVVGGSDPFFTKSEGAWMALEDAGAPLSSAIARFVGHPVLAVVRAPDLVQRFHIDYATLGVGDTSFSLAPGEQADLTIVSPRDQAYTLVAETSTGPRSPRQGRYELQLIAPAGVRASGSLPPQGDEMQIPVRLDPGINHLALQLAPSSRATTTAVPSRAPMLVVKRLSLSSS